MTGVERCRCGHTKAEHFFDGWGQPFGCCADGAEWAPGRTIKCRCSTWAPAGREAAGR